MIELKRDIHNRNEQFLSICINGRLNVGKTYLSLLLIKKLFSLKRFVILNLSLNEENFIEKKLDNAYREIFKEDNIECIKTNNFELIKDGDIVLIDESIIYCDKNEMMKNIKKINELQYLPIKFIVISQEKVNNIFFDIQIFLNNSITNIIF
ncbi:MAG: hypothetical protein WC934_06105 [Acidithiobacillus sp.]|jgi:hypothetical protein|uniref:hypothetical protein n=1 Tax=Acidithiobacillus sp. TaxID=1872118 RepID=UPI00355ECC5B